MASRRARVRLSLALLAAAALGGARAQDPTPTDDLAPLPPLLREEAAGVAGDPTVRCAVDARVRCGRTTYRWLLAHLPFAARAIDALGLEEVGRYAIEDAPAEGPGRFTIDDRAGASAACERALDVEGRTVVLARGQVDVALLPRILGTGLVDVRYAPAPDDPDTLECRASVAFRVHSRLLHALTAPLREALASVLRGKLELLLRSATALAERCERDPWQVVAALEARGTASAADLEAFRREVLVR